LSKAYRRNGQKELADEQIKLTEQLRQIDSDKTKSVVLGNQGNSALAQGNAEDAINNYTEALRLEPRNAKLYYDLSLAYRRRGDSRAELSSLKQAEACDPALAIVHDQLGVLYMEAGNQDSAEDEFSKALALQPEFTDALNNLGCLEKRERMKRLRPLYGEQLRVTTHLRRLTSI
jgi:Flp pilus assembly protein TadD